MIAISTLGQSQKNPCCEPLGNVLFLSVFTDWTCCPSLTKIYQLIIFFPNVFWTRTLKISCAH